MRLPATLSFEIRFKCDGQRPLSITFELSDYEFFDGLRKRGFVQIFPGISKSFASVASSAFATIQKFASVPRLEGGHEGARGRKRVIRDNDQLRPWRQTSNRTQILRKGKKQEAWLCYMFGYAICYICSIFWPSGEKRMSRSNCLFLSVLHSGVEST